MFNINFHCSFPVIRSFHPGGRRELLIPPTLQLVGMVELVRYMSTVAPVQTVKKLLLPAAIVLVTYYIVQEQKLGKIIAYQVGILLLQGLVVFLSCVC